jgi:hypothetical protein
VCAYALLQNYKGNQLISPVVTPSVSDLELLPERNEFEGDGVTVAVQR